MKSGVPKGFLSSGVSAGIKKNRQKDLGLIYSTIPSTVAGVFTKNRIQAAPVQLCRQRLSGGKGQAIAKAVGMNKGVRPHVLDATAGLGGDAFVLATLGCEVTMIERSPIAFSLLEDGLKRARSFAQEKSDDDLFCILNKFNWFIGY